MCAAAEPGIFFPFYNAAKWALRASGTSGNATAWRGSWEGKRNDYEYS